MSSSPPPAPENGESGAADPSAPATFTTPQIQDNPTGWGPNAIPPQFKDMPYQPFSKSDRLGKVRGAVQWEKGRMTVGAIS